jgi:hypothetical protein
MCDRLYKVRAKGLMATVDSIPLCVKKQASSENVAAILRLSVEQLLSTDDAGWQEIERLCVGHENCELYGFTFSAVKHIWAMIPRLLIDLDGDGFYWLMVSGLCKRLYSLITFYHGKLHNDRLIGVDVQSELLHSIAARTDLYELLGLDILSQRQKANTLREVIVKCLRPSIDSDACVRCHDMTESMTESMIRLDLFLLPPPKRRGHLLNIVRTRAKYVFYESNIMDSYTLHLYEKMWKELGYESNEFYSSAVVGFSADVNPVDVLKKVLVWWSRKLPSISNELFTLSRLIVLWMRARNCIVSVDELPPIPPTFEWVVFDSFAVGYSEPWLTKLAKPERLAAEFKNVIERGWAMYSVELLNCVSAKDVARLVIEFLHPTKPYF